MVALQVAAAWVAGLSLVAFVVAVHDKRQARRRQGRVSERALLLLALAGGSPGLLAAMLLARHKTRKGSFLLRFGLVLVLQLLLVAWLMTQRSFV